MVLFRNAALLRVRDVVRLLVLERLEQIGVVDVHLRVLYPLSDELLGASGVIHENLMRGESLTRLKAARHFFA